MTNKALVEALEQLSRLPSQVRLDLGAAHSEICKLQGLDPKKHTWPEWSSIANTLRWLDVLEDTARTALASSGNEAPGDDKGLVEPEAVTRFRQAFTAETGDGRMFTLDDARAIIAHIDRLTALSSGNEVAKVVGWQPIDTAPKDAPILAWCASTCDDPKCVFSGSEEDCKAPDGSYALCLFHGHAEGLCACPPGLQIVQWGGGWSDGYEDGGGYMPDWWFRVGSEFEEAANPTHWMPLPASPASDAAPLTGGGGNG